MTTTSSNATFTPVLHYDFNTPPDSEGIRWTLPGPWHLPFGTRVKLDAGEDDVYAVGTVVAHRNEGRGPLVGVRVFDGPWAR